MPRVLHRLIVGFFSLVALAIFLRSPGINHNKPSSFGPMIYGSADRPFVLRPLLPQAVRRLAALAPLKWKLKSTDAARNGWLKDIFVELDGIPPEYALEFLIAAFLMWAALYGFLYCLEALARSLVNAPPGFVAKLPYIALLLLPPMFCYTSLLYDFPVLLFVTLLFTLLAKRRFIPYLVVFGLACLNKETTILLAGVFALHFFTERRRPWYWAMLAGQLLIWAVIGQTIQRIYRNNPGNNREFALVYHNLHLIAPAAKQAPVSLGTAAGVLVLAALVGIGWNEKPLLMRRALWMLPVLLVLCVPFGFLDELRDYYEALPVISILIWLGIGKLAGLSISPRQA